MIKVTMQALQKVRKGTAENISFQTTAKNLQGRCRCDVAVRYTYGVDGRKARQLGGRFEL